MFAPSTLRRILNASTIQQCLPALRCSSTFPSPSSRPAASPFISSPYPSPSSAVRSSLASPSTLLSLRNHSSNPFSSQRRSLHTTPPASGPRDYDRKPPLPPTRFSKNYQVGKTKPPVGSGDPSKQGKWSYDRKGRTLLSAFADKLDKLEPDGVIFALICMNIIVFAMWQAAQWQASNGKVGLLNWMGDHFTTSWANISAGRNYTTFAASFSHMGPLHIAINMFVLYSFAPLCISILGVAQFMLLYGTSGIFSCYMAAVIPTLFFDMPSHPAYGSSGATCGLLGFLACAMPHDKFIALFGFIGVTGLQFLGATALIESARLAWEKGHNPSACGHMSGVAMGVVFFQLMKLIYGRGRR